MRSLSLVLVALFSLVVLALPGCGQQSGDVCEVDSDCASGLQCLCRVGAASRGLCLSAGASCAVTANDTGVAGNDAGRDAAASTQDAGDDAGTDAGTGGTDAGGTDAGGTDAGGVDAGGDAGDAPDAT